MVTAWCGRRRAARSPAVSGEVLAGLSWTPARPGRATEREHRARTGPRDEPRAAPTHHRHSDPRCERGSVEHDAHRDRRVVTVDRRRFDRELHLHRPDHVADRFEGGSEIVGAVERLLARLERALLQPQRLVEGRREGPLLLLARDVRRGSLAFRGGRLASGRGRRFLGRLPLTTTKRVLRNRRQRARARVRSSSPPPGSGSGRDGSWSRYGFLLSEGDG
jgi:hypothetical protein